MNQLPALPSEMFHNVMGFIRGGLRSDWKSCSLVSRTFIQDYLTWTRDAVRMILSDKMHLDREALDSYLDGKVRHLEESLEQSGAPEGVRTSIRAIFFDEFLRRLQSVQQRTHSRKKPAPPKRTEAPSPSEISLLSQTDQDSEFFLSSIKNKYPEMHTAYSTIYANKAVNAKEKLEALREWTKEHRDLFQSTTALEIHGNNNYKLHSFPMELEYFTELERLCLCNHQIASFKHLPEFPRLKYLNLKGNCIASFEHLPLFPLLNNLGLRGNCIASFKYLPLFPLLEYLGLNGNCIARFKHLPVLPHLKSLSLNENCIASFEHLPALPHLRSLWLEKNCIARFEYLPVLPHLITLWLEKNCITSFEHMPSLPELIYLYLSENLIADSELMPELPKLKLLSLFRNFILNPEFPRKFYEADGLRFEVQGLSFKNGLQERS